MGIRLSGLISGLDTDSIVKELVSAYSTKKDNYVKAQTKLSWTQDAWKEMNSKIYSFYTGTLSDMRFTSFGGMKKTTVSDESKASVKAGSGVTNGTQTLEIKKLATPGFLTGAKLDSGSTVTGSTKLADLGVAAETLSVTVAGEAKTVSITEDMTVDGFVSALKSVGLSANFDKTQQRFFINSTTSGKDNDFEFQGTSNALDALGLSAASGAKKQNASNSEIILNGAQFESSSNNISINGLTINAKAATTSAISITTETDVDGIYDTIKNFLSAYNTLINGMDSAYNAASSKGYEPLTNDDKESMTDTDIEEWEKKIKDSLLRRDSTLDSVASSMKTAMAGVYEVNGKKYSLASFGINTLSYFISSENEKNAYHIDGDTKDSSVSKNTDKLRAAIEADPEAAASFFKEMATGVYNNLSEKMKGTTLRTALNVYNDKQMKEEYDDYSDKIKEWEKKITAMEDSYYKKFSEMETALSKLQSSTSAISGLLGSSS